MAGFLGLTGCATTPRDQSAGVTRDPMNGAITQPFADLSLIRETTAPVLVQAALSPYDPVAAPVCERLGQEVAALNGALGPDLDVAAETSSDVGADLMADAVRGAVGLPFRGVVRRLTGADRRDRAKARAVLAGMVRRGYLKGYARGAGCGGN